MDVDVNLQVFLREVAAAGRSVRFVRWYAGRVNSAVMDQDVMSKYMMMGATYCLLKYIESTQSFSFAPGSLKLKIYDNEAGDFLKIDRRTALNLELINNTRNGSQKNTLFGTINRT